MFTTCRCLNGRGLLPLPPCVVNTSFLGNIDSIKLCFEKWPVITLLRMFSVHFLLCPYIVCSVNMYFVVWVTTLWCGYIYTLYTCGEDMQLVGYTFVTLNICTLLRTL